MTAAEPLDRALARFARAHAGELDHADTFALGHAAGIIARVHNTPAPADPFTMGRAAGIDPPAAGYPDHLDA